MQQDQLTNQLRSSCLLLVKNPDVHNINNLNKFLKSLPAAYLHQAKEFVLYPVRQLLFAKKGFKSEEVVSLLKCLATIFKNAQFSEVRIFEDILNVILQSFSLFKDQNIEIVGSEDQVCAALYAFTCLFNYSAKPLWKNIYSSDRIPMLGHLITVSLKVISEHKSKLLVETAYNFLTALMHPSYISSQLEKKQQKVLYNKIGDVFAGLLPGISTAVYKTLSKESNQNSKSKIAALSCLKQLLLVTLSDKAIISENVKKTSEKKYIDAPETISKLTKKRDRQWIKSVSANVKVILSCFITLANNENYKLRWHVLEVSTELVKRCTSSLSLCTATLLQVPLSLLHDDCEKIRLKSSHYIDYFTNVLQHSAGAAQASILNEINNMLKILPKLLKQAGDNEKVKMLKLFNGYLEVFGSKLDKLSFEISQKIVKVLLPWFSLDFEFISLLEKTNIEAIDYENVTSSYGTHCNKWYFRKQFINHNSNEVQRLLLSICFNIGKYGRVSSLIAFLLEEYKHQQFCCEALIVINEIVHGISQSTSKNVHHVLLDLLDTVLKTENWNLFLSEKSQCNSVQLLKNSEFTVAQSRTTIALACLQLETVGAISNAMQLKFRETLMFSICPVLERALNQHSIISSCAVCLLKTISKSCKYASVADLINSNADYLVSDTMLQIMQIEEFPQTPVILQAMFLNSNVEAFPHLQGVLHEILNAMDLNWHNENLLLKFLDLLQTISQCLRRWFPTKHKDDHQSNIKLNVNEMVENILDYAANLNKAEDLVELSNETAENNDEIAEENCSTKGDEESKAPDQVQAADLIMNSCSNLLSMSSMKVRLKVLDISSECMHVLFAHENSFLPFVHKIWAPLIAKLKEEMPVVIKSFELIYQLAILSKTFVRKRFMESIYPQVLKHIDMQSSVYGSSTISLRHSFSYKLFHRLLKVCGEILIECEIPLDKFKVVCYKCLPYLSSKRPVEMQEAAMNFFKVIIHKYPNFVWFTLNSLKLPSNVYTSFNNNHKSVDFTSSLVKSEDYNVNVEHLLLLF